MPEFSGATLSCINISFIYCDIESKKTKLRNSNNVSPANMAPIKAQSGLRQRIVSLKSLGKLLTQCKLEKKRRF